MKRGLLLAIVAGALALVPSASGSLHTRSCGHIERGIGIEARATANVACSQARRVLPPVLLGSTRCYSGPAQFHPCTIEGFYCTQHYSQASGVSTAHCAKGTKLITGTAGP